jgi:hypothetical protein
MTTIKVGDTVEVTKFVLDTWYHASGTVEQVTNDGIKVNGDWYYARTDYTNKCNVLAVVDPATEKQVAYLKTLGWQGDYNTLRKSQASFEIDDIKAQGGTGTGTGSCHYCGQRATNFGFFGEPVCKGCGG